MALKMISGKKITASLFALLALSACQKPGTTNGDIPPQDNAAETRRIYLEADGKVTDMAVKNLDAGLCDKVALSENKDPCVAQVTKARTDADALKLAQDEQAQIDKAAGSKDIAQCDALKNPDRQKSCKDAVQKAMDDEKNKHLNETLGNALNGKTVSACKDLKDPDQEKTCESSFSETTAILAFKAALQSHKLSECEKLSADFKDKCVTMLTEKLKQ